MKKSKLKIAINIKPYFEEVDGYLHSIYPFGTEIEIFVHKTEHGYWNTTHTLSGRSMYDGASIRKDAVKATITKLVNMTKKVFDKYINNTITVDQHIFNMEAADIVNQERKEKIYNLHTKLGGIKCYLCPYSLMMNKININILRLDKDLHTPENISMHDYIIDKFGEDAANEVNSLI